MCYTCFAESNLGKSQIQKAIEKAQKPRLDLERLIEEKQSESILKNILNQLKTNTHEYVRIRDKGKDCISCSTSWKDSFQAGHFYKSETNSILRYNIKNIHSQCVQCNIHNDGNESGYRVGLLNRFNEAYVSQLDKIAIVGKRTTIKLSIIEAKEMLKEIRLKLKELKKNNE